MTLLAPGFACFSTHSASPLDVDQDARAAEIDRELAHRRDAYPRFVARDSMTQGEADAGIAAIAAIAADQHAMLTAAAFTPSIPWADKIATLRREINDRRTTYRRQIARDLLSIDDARARMSAIEAVHWHYWHGLHGWCTADRLDTAHHAAIWAHCQAIDALGGLAAALDQRLAFPGNGTPERAAAA